VSFALNPEKIWPMEARSVEDLPTGTGWQFEPKWDGFRCLIFRDGEHIRLQGKSGKPLTAFFPEMVEALGRARVSKFVLDGELVVPEGTRLSFERLQARLHPAESRRRRLAKETPAKLILFDILADSKSLLDAPLIKRRAALEKLFQKLRAGPELVLSPQTREARQARAWLAEAGAGVLDGVMAKRLDAPYEMGERAMLKIKPRKTADCVVGGFRYATGSRQVGSLLLGLYDKDGKLNHVGFTSGISDAERPALTAKLEKLKGGPGFTGAAPGGPSRWSTERSAQWNPLRPDLVVEVQYDHFSGGRFRHGTRLMRWRPDKAPRQCVMDQVKPGSSIQAVLSGSGKAS
jgi:ATP-dependent DNA ligase